jgi:hypothetical protein
MGGVGAKPAAALDAETALSLLVHNPTPNKSAVVTNKTKRIRASCMTESPVLNSAE